MNLMLLETETNTADLDAETFAADEYNKKFKRINIIFKSKSNREESDDSSSVQSISKRKFKLPLLELKSLVVKLKTGCHFGFENEVEGEERINLAMKGFSVKDNPKIYSLKNLCTLLAGLFAGSRALLTVPFATKKNQGKSKNSL
ncbi:hypothetical protein CEXT_361971 [Caerostris extrusa]|uniref:Uncharacterized protein n=1 Tax=Caerostris extrusa TaxID=172846 RepID=A0AAV4Y157_CAEEX|nr:hypothetical protein CEXT_361971 [Caerostris extrusa]